MIGRETEVLGENLPQCRFVHHKPHMLPVRKPGPLRWEASVQPLELGTATSLSIYGSTALCWTLAAFSVS
jgi:hypothetical protein